MDPILVAEGYKQSDYGEEEEDMTSQYEKKSSSKFTKGYETFSFRPLLDHGQKGETQLLFSNVRVSVCLEHATGHNFLPRNWIRVWYDL